MSGILSGMRIVEGSAFVANTVSISGSFEIVIRDANGRCLTR